MACVGKPLRWRIETAFVRVKRGRRSSMALRLRYLIAPAAAGQGRGFNARRHCPPARRRTRFARHTLTQQTYCEHRSACPRTAAGAGHHRRPARLSRSIGVGPRWALPPTGVASAVPASSAAPDAGWRTLTGHCGRPRSAPAAACFVHAGPLLAGSHALTLVECCRTLILACRGISRRAGPNPSSWDSALIKAEGDQRAQPNVAGLPRPPTQGSLSRSRRPRPLPAARWLPPRRVQPRAGAEPTHSGRRDRREQLHPH